MSVSLEYSFVSTSHRSLAAAQGCHKDDCGSGLWESEVQTEHKKISFLLKDTDFTVRSTFILQDLC